MKNGRLSSGKGTKHLDIRYFWVKDLLERGVIRIEHCSTEDIVADFFTKSLQGKKFRIMKDLILNRSISLTWQYRSVMGNSRCEAIVRESERTVTTSSNWQNSCVR
jgi:hypothetical protein